MIVRYTMAWLMDTSKRISRTRARCFLKVYRIYKKVTVLVVDGEDAALVLLHGGLRQGDDDPT